MKFSMLILLLYHVRHCTAYACDSKPKGALGQPTADHKFRIVIATNPEWYIPNQRYNVTLHGKNSVKEEPTQFNGFSLTVQPRDINDMSSAPDPLAAGLLEVFPGDMNAKIDEGCPNMVIHTSHTFVSRIDVQWTAPPPGSGCVQFRASVMEQNFWYQNSGGLTLDICEDDNIKSDDVAECNACDEAKYEMRFEGMWTRQSHPLYFPTNVWLTRFSDVIGASHGASYRLWKIGENASQGLIDFLEMENTTTLETEIKSNETRTVVKAKGLKYPNISGRTFAVFRVDKDHHLLSIISLIIPSPDWFVGVSGLELCNNTEWIAEKTLDLYPYDLGLYGDLQYTSKTIHTNELITKIDHATEYASPFHTNNTEKLKPLAQVHLTRSRIYERNCESTTPSEERPPRLEGPQMTNFYPSNNDIINTKMEVPTTQETCVGASCSNKCFIDNQKINQSLMSQCSYPECDAERVKGYFPDWNEETRQQCLEKKFPIEIVSTTDCRADCDSKEEKKMMTERQKLKSICFTTPWQPFSACDPKSCFRIRTRTLVREEDKKSNKCLKLIFSQKIECPSPACTPSSQTQIKQSG